MNILSLCKFISFLLKKKLKLTNVILKHQIFGMLDLVRGLGDFGPLLTKLHFWHYGPGLIHDGLGHFV